MRLEGNIDAAYLAGISISRIPVPRLPDQRCPFVARWRGARCEAERGQYPTWQRHAAPLDHGALIGGASLLGGRGTIVGALPGVLALGMLTNGMDLLGVHTYFQIAVRAALLIAVVAIDAFAHTLPARRAPGPAVT